MTIEIVVVFEDGRRERIGEFEDLSETVIDAVLLADKYGRDNGDGHGPPRSVEVRSTDRLELSLSVIRGGLIPDDATRVTS